MATKQGKDRTALVKCEYCGEYYSVTYKQCPFCEEYEEDFDADPEVTPRRTSGGKRLSSNTRGGGYGRGWTPARIIVTVASLAIIIAAACIVFSLIKPLVDRGKVDPSPSPTVTVSPSAEPSPSDVPELTPSPSVSPVPTPSQIPSTQTANGFTLNKSDFTLSKAGETYRIKTAFTPAGSTGFVTWSSSNPAVVSVSEDGTVTGLTKGTATITATMAGGVSKTCIVRCTFSGTAEPTTAPTAAPSSGTLSLNRSDFTLSKAGETFRLKVSGASGTVTWSISNSSVASLSGDGTVTAKANGTCTVTAKADGQSLTCIVRVNF